MLRRRCDKHKPWLQREQALLRTARVHVGEGKGEGEEEALSLLLLLHLSLLLLRQLWLLALACWEEGSRHKGKPPRAQHARLRPADGVGGEGKAGGEGKPGVEEGVEGSECATVSRVAVARRGEGHHPDSIPCT